MKGKKNKKQSEQKENKKAQEAKNKKQDDGGFNSDEEMQSVSKAIEVKQSSAKMEDKKITSVTGQLETPQNPNNHIIMDDLDNVVQESPRIDFEQASQRDQNGGSVPGTPTPLRQRQEATSEDKGYQSAQKEQNLAQPESSQKTNSNAKEKYLSGSKQDEAKTQAKSRKNKVSFDYRPVKEEEQEQESLKLDSKPPKKVEFQQKPIPLISWNASKDIFEIGEEAKALVSQIKGPIGVLCVAGVYRTGKSFLLNRCLLNVQNGIGFGVGPSINPCTKGLWIWGTPIPGYTEEGEPLNVLVVDTEGIGGLDEDNSHDMRIFSLAVLLSSYFVYNSMGSIDENALSSISFVTSLSKHIRCNTENEQDASDQKWAGSGDDDHLIHHMPRFMWTVRDFTLQLVNDQNVEIGPKQYLEKALEDLPDASGTHTNKNEVKQHLRKYFPERDCFTMVRPVVKEELLQSLDSIGMEDLRPEFVEQVFSLRKKVMHAMKPKQINNQPMDGALWIALTEQYLVSINGGTVPSIESSWTYICQSKAQSQFEALKGDFEASLSADLNIPMNETELQSCYDFHSEKLKRELLGQFSGEKEIQATLAVQVEEFLKYRLTELAALNLSECRLLSSSTLTSLFQELNSRFMADPGAINIGSNVRSLEITLHEIWTLYDANVPEYQEKCLIFLNGKAQFLNDLLYFVHANMENENQSVNKILNELQDRNHSSILEAKEQSRLEKQAMETKLKETLLAKAELEACNELLKEQYQALKEKKETSEQEWQGKITELKSNMQKQAEEQRHGKEDFEEHKQCQHRSNIKAQSEFEKERALLDQKVQFLEKSLAEKTEKEKEHMHSWHSQNKELSNEIRQVCQKYEAELKQASLQLDEEREKTGELETSLLELQNRHTLEQADWKKSEARYKEMLEQSQDHARQMEAATQALGKDSVTDLKTRLKDKSEIVEDLTSKFKLLEERTAAAEEELKTKLQQSLKDMAIKEQQLEFQEIQLRETRVQLEEANRQHQSMVEAMKRQAEEETKPALGEDEKELPDSPSKVERLQKRIESLSSQLSQVQESQQELEIQLKLKEAEAERLQKELTVKVEDLEQQRSSLATQIAASESSQGLLLQELEHKHRLETHRYEQDLEEKQQLYDTDTRAVQQRSEESLAQLKNFYEIEKDKLENRVREERDKAQKKIGEFHEEFEKKMSEEFAEKDEEIEILRDSLADLDQRHSQQTTQVQHELTMKQQIIETLEKQNQDARGRLELMETTRNQAFEKQLEFFESQRQEYNNKIDKLQGENIEKDRQLAQVNHKYERIVEDFERKHREIQQAHEQLQRERDHLHEKHEIVRQKLSDLQDEAQQSQLVYGREQALSHQSLEFLQRKIQEQQAQLEEQSVMLDQKLITAKQETAEEKQHQLDRVQNERDLWEQKFEQKRKALKEVEQQLNRENAELEKKVCLLQENLTRLDAEKRRQEAEYQERIAEAEAQINQLDSSAGEAFYFGNAQAESVMQLKTNMQEYERQLSDLQSMYDKDKALWEGKCKFLENQKENYKKDLVESQRKFEITLEQLQKRGHSAHDKYEHNQNTIMKVLETKYKTQIKEMLESHQSLQHEFLNKNKRLEEDNKILGQGLAVSKRETELEVQTLKQRLEEHLKAEFVHRADAAELKNQLESKSSSFQQQSRQDKDTYKQKLVEAERKIKEADTKRSQMLFDFEKEKARWQMEYDNVLNQRRELEDQNTDLERRKDLLFKENERLKAEWKANRSSTDGRSSRGGEGIPRLGLGLGASLTASASGLPPSTSSAGYGKSSSVLKSKPGVLNQASQPSGAFSSFTSKRPSLGAGLNLTLSQQAKLPPQPQKYQFQMQQPMLSNQGGLQLNTRYGNQGVTESESGVGQDLHQDESISQENSYPETLQQLSEPNSNLETHVSAGPGQYQAQFTNKAGVNVKTSSRYSTNNENENNF